MKLRLKQKRDEVSGVVTFVFEPPEPIIWQPGQYMHYELDSPQPDDRGVERLFTISSAPFEKDIQVTTRFDGERVSSFKQALRAIEIGSEVEADGPKGSFLLAEGDGRHVLIAGGIGITPYRSMLAQLAHEGRDKKIDLLYANRDDNFVFGEELEALKAKLPSLTIHKFAGQQIEKSDLDEFLAGETSIFYLSGPKAMVESYEQLLTDSGVSEDRIKTDYFPGY
jgi:ferredoxin-NADP reductase